MSAPEHTTESTYSPGAALCSAGALAADILREACGSGPKSRQLEVVGNAALDLKDQFEALRRVFEGPTSGEESALAAEGATRCADLANLAACAVPELPAGREAARAAVHLAAGAARAFGTLVREAASGDGAGYASRDARGAGWRVGLAVRQVEGPAEPED